MSTDTAAAPVRRNGRRLPPPLRKALLSAHVITAVGLLGVDLTVLALGIAGWRDVDPLTVYPAAHLLVEWLLLPLAVLSWVTGVLLAVLTPWGLFRNWWVTIKLAFNTVGLVLATFVLLPLVTDHADAARLGPALGSAVRSELVRDSSAATIVLTASVLLAVYKPFGRIRRRRTTSHTGGTAAVPRC